jgi:sugar lactone lactonase YvrE
VRRFGDGTAGFVDGPSGTARLSRPNGLALDLGSETLWVADTHNHAIRRIDLGTGEVTTVAGTGEKGQLLPTASIKGWIRVST